VLKEGAIAAGTGALIILLFWARGKHLNRASHPLSILDIDIVLVGAWASRSHDDTGGMALAVGSLVDDATVEIEMSHRNMAMKKPSAGPILMERLK